MKKAALITTTIGSIILAILGIILSVVLMASAMEFYSSSRALLIFASLFYLSIMTIIPVIGVVFIFLKNTKLNFVGYILAIVGGGLSLIIWIMPLFILVQMLGALAGIPTLTGGILGVIAVKKNK